MRGHRKLKPAKLKLLAGNPGKRQVPETVEYPAHWPERPKWLGAIGCAEWEKCMKDMEAAGVVANVDGVLLAGYCDAVDCAVRASKKARKDASWNAERRASWQLAYRMGALFGIGPAERVKVPRGGSGKAKDEKAKFFA